MTETSFALYRKYRPQTFSEVRNQDHIVRVLEGAIAKNAVPHALLFTGSRGTGKTTVARIFARAIGATEVDIYEIDAASNRGIDDIRALRESVHTLPYESPYKVYIIDEVHMLTKEAFNALLKTLEEPPSHVIFILATTERDKLLDTITSRCQVFEFHAPTRAQLREMVLRVAQDEKYVLDEHVADVIALAAGGSYRDALGITQKVMMSSTDTVLTADEVADIVGAPRQSLLLKMVEALAKKDVAQGLDVLMQVQESNSDIKLFYALLLERLRAIMFVRFNQNGADTILASFSDEEVSFIRAIAQDRGAQVHSTLLAKALMYGAYIGKSYVATLPLELLLIEHSQA
ncbi:MAG TPA: DNA polymerase III subunit gamma/tau [Candidatus Paceibacterota bacterium]|nr:DNA polymerase III subunit gamma/tau [Candidatus Paceibacterota bacterium]